MRRWRELVTEKSGRILFDRPKPTVGCSANGRILFDRPKPTVGCSANGRILFDRPKPTVGCSANGRILFDRPKPTVGCSANGRRRHTNSVSVVNIASIKKPTKLNICRSVSLKFSHLC